MGLPTSRHTVSCRPQSEILEQEATVLAVTTSADDDVGDLAALDLVREGRVGNAEGPSGLTGTQSDRRRSFGCRWLCLTHHLQRT